MQKLLIAALTCTALAYGSSAHAGASDVPTINTMTISTFGDYSQQYAPSSGQFMIFGGANEYLLSNGTSWQSGAGQSSETNSSVTSVSTSGNTITYNFSPNVTNYGGVATPGVLFRNTDYANGDHSAQGVLGLPDSLEIIAQAGSTTAQIEGYTTILSNTETWYGEPRFNFYSAPVGASVFFDETYTLLNGATFTPGLFSTNFTYNETGYVNFLDVEPTAGPAQAPEPASLAIFAAGLLGLYAFNRRKA